MREAVINAVCHRDYTIPSNTEVRIYDDKLFKQVGVTGKGTEYILGRWEGTKDAIKAP